MANAVLAPRYRSVLPGFGTALREPDPPTPARPRLLDRVRAELRTRHYSRRTEKAYAGWIRRYILFHGKRHPSKMGASEITAFLSALAVRGNVAASTQNQALSAVLFLYRDVLGLEVPWLDEVVRAKRPDHLPVVLTRDEVRAVISRLTGRSRLMALLLYGAGLGLREGARLRVKDVDFSRNQITVRSGKGDRDRMTMLPGVVKADLGAHLEAVRREHERDLRHGAGWVELPWALARKYPNAGREWAWQWVFPATRIYVDRATGQRRRHHLHESVIQRAVRDAVRLTGIPKRATCHTFRHSFRHPPPRGWSRHPDRPGAAGPLGRQHDNDLHARAEPRACRCAEPGGPSRRTVVRAAAPAYAAERPGISEVCVAPAEVAADGSACAFGTVFLHRRRAGYHDGRPRYRATGRCYMVPATRR